MPLVRTTAALVLVVCAGHSEGGDSSATTRPEALVAEFGQTIEPLLEAFCYDCHNTNYSEAGPGIDTLDPDAVRGDDAEHWRAILDRINAGEMPPEGSDQPDGEERRLLVDWIDRALDAAREERLAQAMPSLRRLTKRQYAHTLRELLGVPIVFGRDLPDDAKSERGFTNGSASQQTSVLHLEYYQSIAREALGKAIVVGPRPESIHRRVRLGHGVGRGGDAAMIGGYQSAPIDREHVRVEVLDQEGRPVAATTPEGRKRLAAIEGNIGIGMRGSNSDRFRVVEKGLVLYSALPHREVSPKTWQGPSPNLKMLVRRDFPTEGPFALRVTASRATREHTRRLDGLYTLRTDETMASLNAEGLLIAPPEARVIKATRFHELSNLELTDGGLRSTDLTRLSSAAMKVDVQRAGHYQIELVHPPTTEADTPSVGLRVDDSLLQVRLSQQPEGSQELIVSPIAQAWLGKGKHTLRISGRFFVGLRELVLTPLADDHPAAVKLSGEHAENQALYEEETPVLRVFVGARTDDGMEYHTFGEPVAVENGPGDARTYEFRDHLENLPIPQVDLTEEGDLSNILILGLWNDYLVKHKKLSGPPLLVESIEFETALHETWPPASHRRVFFDSPLRETDRDAYAREVIHRFLNRAFRRPALPGEIDRYHAHWRSLREDFPSLEESVRETLVAALCSPHFLYYDRPDEPGEEHGLSARVAYFLWDSPPDEWLDELAAGRRISETLPDVVGTMLADEKAMRFVEVFASEWLRLDRLENLSVDAGRHPEFTRFIKRDMREETLRFFLHALRENLSASVLIESDFAMLNQNLAEFYGVEGVTGVGFRPVPLVSGSRRGGLLSQGAFLTGHSNGVDPHPIKRAVWLKERVLGEPPPSPPPNVPELNPDTPGFEKLSLKERLELHRDKASCLDCHKKIDPYGLVFEEYDGVGRLRKGGFDASVELPDGSSLDGVAEMKRYILDKRYDAFLRSLAENLFAYATGQSITYLQDPEIDAIVEAAREDDRLRSIVLAVCRSPGFLGRAAEGGRSP